MESPSSSPAGRSSAGLWTVRYGIGWVLVLAGLIVLVINPGGFGVDGFAMAAGSGLSVLMINWLYRLGVNSDEERREEEDARVYLAKYGRWPDQKPPSTPSGPPR